MAGSVTFNISPKVLQWARNSMGYSIEEVALKVGVTLEKYESWELGENKPTYKQLENLAEKVYKRPLAVLLMTEPPIENEIQKDFRNLTNSEVTHLSPELRLALRKAKRYQYILEEVTINDDLPQIRNFSVKANEAPDKLASRLREFMNFPLSEQINWKLDDAYKNFQKKVEDLGVFVFKMKLPIIEARAFCLTGNYPVIVLNTDDSSNGRIFSLFHELCHVILNSNDLFNDKKNATSNEYTKTEAYCNKFAASFLIPDTKLFENILIDNPHQNKIDEDKIETLANIYKVSKEVIARKLLELNLLEEPSFWNMKKRWDYYAKLAKEKRNEKLKETDSGINQGIKILYEKGKPYVLKVYNSYSQGNISSSDLSNFLETKLTNLPKIIERLNY
jgi:Zn-dependent peptidase ImmA (M78 family)